MNVRYAGAARSRSPDPKTLRGDRAGVSADDGAHVSDVEIAEQLLGTVETLTPTFVQLLHGPDGRRVWCLDAGRPRLGPQ